MRRKLVILWIIVGSLLPINRVHAQARLSCGELVHPATGPAFAPTITPGANLVSVGELLYFISRDETGAGADPKYLWRTNGTPTGTFTVTAASADFLPLYLFAAVNGKLIFRASTPDTGAELWSSDGTAQGTQLLKDMSPGAADTSYHANWFILGNRLFFATYEEGKDRWWSTTGTAESTVPLDNLYPGAQPENSHLLTQDETVAYLVSFGSNRDVTLWRFDESGFHAVKQFMGDETSNDITTVGQGLIQNDHLYFFATVAGGPSGLWRSDGTEAGTELIFPGAFVSDPNGGVATGVHPYSLVATKSNSIYFFEYDQPLLRLRRLDSGRNTITAVKTIRIRSEDGLYYDLHFDSAIAYDQQIYFSLWWRDNRLLPAGQTELWTSDGTEAGTRFLTTLPMGGGFAFGIPQGLFLTTSLGVAGTYIFTLPWDHPAPTIVCDLGSHFYAYPRLFLHNQVIYVTGRNAWLGTEHLWRLDPSTLQPTNVYLPSIVR